MFEIISPRNALFSDEAIVQGFDFAGDNGFELPDVPDNNGIFTAGQRQSRRHQIDLGGFVNDKIIEQKQLGNKFLEDIKYLLQLKLMEPCGHGGEGLV